MYAACPCNTIWRASQRCGYERHPTRTRAHRQPSMMQRRVVHTITRGRRCGEWLAPTRHSVFADNCLVICHRLGAKATRLCTSEECIRSGKWTSRSTAKRHIKSWDASYRLRNIRLNLRPAKMPIATTNPTSNGHEAGELDESPRVPAKAGSKEDEQLVINTIRCLGADLCQQVSRA